MKNVKHNPSLTQKQVLDLSLLSSREKEDLLKKWNNTKTNYPQNQCIHQLFEEQVKKTPHKIAVRFEDRQLTYQQLNQRANQVARYLQKVNVVPETMVGICLERSLDLIVGLLGILKAGGSYVPLDPAYPYDRLAFILQDLQLPILLTEHSCLERLPQHQAHTILIDADERAIALCNDSNLKSTVTANNLAYTIYNSGTGKPKGVQISHQAVVNFLSSMRHEPGMNSQDIMLATTTICFNIASLEIYLPLIVGAEIVLVSREVATSSTKLAQSLALGVTVMQAIPSTWRSLLASGWKGNKQLKVLCGGEALPKGLATQLLQKVSSLWNMYGAPETTSWSIISQVKPNQTQIFIGRPIANTQIYLLDPLLRRKSDPIKPVPVGVIGEMWIGGASLARGYFNREQMPDQFVPNPFSNEPNSYLYKTGDLARYLPDGTIEFIGRIDNQVKIHGCRIELEDVESTIAKHHAVRETVVVAREDLAHGDKYLAAYLVLETQFFQKAQSKFAATNIERNLQWRDVWNNAYSQAITSVDIQPSLADKSISGWPRCESSNSIVHRILASKPGRVLEIGCGMGLTMSKIAPHCEYYMATDIADVAIDYLKQQLASNRAEWTHISVAVKDAIAAFTGIESATIDTVILNCVVQYFPNIDYLAIVLEKAAKVVKPGGRIFISDVGNLALLEAFHTSVQLEQFPHLSSSQLQQRIQQKIDQEPELVIEPAFFTTLKHYLPQIGAVEIHLNRGQSNQEFTPFRYDVVLHIGKEIKPNSEVLWQAWQPELNLAAIGQILHQTKPETLAISCIPHPRLLKMQAMELLQQCKIPLMTAEDLQPALSSIEPKDLWNLSQQLAYKVDIMPSSDRFSYDVVFARDSLSLWATPAYGSKAIQPRHTYANHPEAKQNINKLVKQLKALLTEELPEQAIPSVFVTLEALPVTSNGKVDRRALLEPNRFRPNLTEEFVTPTNPIEEKLAEIWAQFLEIKPVGIHDSFFELGGHSLLAVQILARIKDIFAVDISLAYFLQSPTIAQLACAIAL